uniref:Uncharacterized protein n=1 Tax=Rhizophora mucronata TaxID=61149 RepID=A0A2P2IH63_RHIMU
MFGPGQKLGFESVQLSVGPSMRVKTRFHV